MQGDDLKKKDEDKRKVKRDRRKEEQVEFSDVPSDGLCFICVGTSAGWLLSYCDRTQSLLSSATVWLFTWLFVVIRKKKVSLWGVVPGARDWSMGT